MGATIPQMGAAFPIVLQMGATDLCSHPDGGEFSCYADSIRSASSKYMQVDSFEADLSYEVFRNIADLFLKLRAQVFVFSCAFQNHP